jgi:hypothetical protein
MLRLAFHQPEVAISTAIWLEIFSWQNLLSLAALTVAVGSLLYTLSAKALPLVDVRKAYRNEGGAWVVQGDLLDVYNVGRRPMPVRAVGAVNTEGGVDGPASPFEFLGGDHANPETPLVLQPGDSVTFAFPAGWVDTHRRHRLGYRVDWIKGRRRGQRARLAHIVLKGKRLP